MHSFGAGGIWSGSRSSSFQSVILQGLFSPLVQMSSVRDVNWFVQGNWGVDKDYPLSLIPVVLTFNFQNLFSASSNMFPFWLANVHISSWIWNWASPEDSIWSSCSKNQWWWLERSRICKYVNMSAAAKETNECNNKGKKCLAKSLATHPTH